MPAADEATSLKGADRGPSGWGSRHTLCLLCFWGLALTLAHRVNLSIAIVAMVNQTEVNANTTVELGVECPELELFELDAPVRRSITLRF